MRVRAGGSEDFDAAIALGDEAVVWMNARGNTTQWGTEPWTGHEKREQAVYYGLLGDCAWVAETETGEIVGILLAADQAPGDTPDTVERELYVNWLLTSRRHAGRGIGAMLVERVKEEAAERGVDLIRVDCWSGEDGNLVRVYENYGFRRVREFLQEDWPGMLLEMRLSEQ
jgi:GNAT superfamily N-acetyltransferase